MALLKKQTPDEKEAARLEKERQAAQQAQQRQLQDQQKAEQARLQQVRQAAAAEKLRQHIATIPKYEYKVLTLSSAIWGTSGGKFGTSGLEKQLNEQAAQGWRVIEIAMSGKIEKALSADRNDIYIVFERPAAG